MRRLLLIMAALFALAVLPVQAQYTEPDPVTLVFTLTDIPGGFAADPTSTGELSNAMLAEREGADFGSQIEQMGRVGGWQTAFDRVPGFIAPGQVVRVQSNVSAFSSEVGVTQYLDSAVEYYLNLGGQEISTTRSYADGSRAIRVPRTDPTAPDGFQRVIYHVIAMRQGSLYASVITGALPGAESFAETERLAEVKEAKLKAVVR